MHIEFESENLDITQPLEQYAREKLTKIEKRWGDRITRVRVYINDTNSGKGGIDKHCTMEARVHGIEPVVAEATTEEAYDAMNVTVDKLKRALEHEIESRKARKS